MLWKLKAEANANTMTNSTFKKGTMSSKNPQEHQNEEREAIPGTEEQDQF